MAGGPRMVPGEPDDAAFAPTVWSAIARHAVLVCVVALLGALSGAVVTKMVTTKYTATSTIAVTQPQLGQTVGGSANAPNPSQYLDSQVVLLGSSAVAQAAATDGNTALHQQAFTASDFSG
ncbi:MAG TPA: Wzz/FepE/Etk N-terminal domain-containing protein, partial [Acidimicrobiales bacterium]|nr:Wzz/FepE/Etk N-terminal domain-containing protein [Acidimicrobiales bacterium]